MTPEIRDTLVRSQNLSRLRRGLQIRRAFRHARRVNMTCLLVARVLHIETHEYDQDH